MARQTATVVTQSSRKAALGSKTAHSFTPGGGYFQHSAPPLPVPGKHPDGRCSPPANAADGSVHYLRVPGSVREMRFTWISAEKAWERPGGLRMAFPAAYLSKAGWTYGRAA